MVSFLIGCVSVVAILLVFVEMRLILLQNMFNEWIKAFFEGNLGLDKKVMEEFINLDFLEETIFVHDEQATRKSNLVSFNKTLKYLVYGALVLGFFALFCLFLGYLEEAIKNQQFCFRIALLGNPICWLSSESIILIELLYTLTIIFAVFILVNLSNLVIKVSIKNQGWAEVHKKNLRKEIERRADFNILLAS